METLRKYGMAPFRLVVIHGGPGAPGEMAPVARELASLAGVVEPMQTRASVEGQIEELVSVLEKTASLPVTLIGYSWGAWLSVLVTARVPHLVRKLVLVSCGPFEDHWAVQGYETRMSRLNEREQKELRSIIQSFGKGPSPHRNDLLRRMGELCSKADYYDFEACPSEVLEYQGDVFEKVWGEAAKLRTNGDLMKAVKSIPCPVVAIHGDYDPHPANGVKVPLAAVLKDFRFHLVEHCGHCPWNEKQAREKFFGIVRSEIL